MQWYTFQNRYELKAGTENGRERVFMSRECRTIVVNRPRFGSEWDMTRELWKGGI